MPKTRRRKMAPVTRVANAFDPDALKRICEMHEEEFADAYNLKVMRTPRPVGGFYAYGDRGGDVLAVAHLDTVALHSTRTCRFVDTQAGPVVFSRALDDRLGAYVILELLPRLGVQADILLTVGEEDGQSTAQFFDEDRDYNWMFEFDRGGTDVVMYQYEDQDLCKRVEAAGARVGQGSFSDIAYLEHLYMKGVNWGVGYRDYHGARSHAFLNDTFDMVAKFLAFHEQNKGVALPHDPYGDDWSSSLLGDGWDDDEHARREQDDLLWEGDAAAKGWGRIPKVIYSDEDVRNDLIELAKQRLGQNLGTAATLPSGWKLVEP